MLTCITITSLQFRQLFDCSLHYTTWSLFGLMDSDVYAYSASASASGGCRRMGSGAAVASVPPVAVLDAELVPCGMGVAA